MNPVAVAFLGSSAAALTASAGSLSLLFSQRLPGVAIGWANALASGFMLGAAYLLMSAGLGYSAWAGAAAALLAVASLHAVDRAGRSALVLHALHSAPEGLAIGGAVWLGFPFGIFMIAAIAIHNVFEAIALCGDLRDRGASVSRTAVLAAGSNSGQVAVATLSAALVWLFPFLLPWVLGAAVGSLAYLVMVDLLPRSYQEIGKTSISLVTLAAMAILVLLGIPG
ncbi:hypothetical protein HRbin33_00731 [bacterium HR33]|nr:hypothetical protein HRbin33_00731 [bacterium HR33]